MKKTFDFGKIDWNGTGKKINLVTVTIELREKGGEETFTIDPKTNEKHYTGERTPQYIEFSASNAVWNKFHTDWIAGGQGLDDIYKFHLHEIKNKELFIEIYNIWKKYHLNSMHAGTPEQEAAIKAWKACGNKYDYTKACDFLRSIDLYEVPFTGKTIGKEYKNELYKYGYGWIINDLPEEITKRVKALIEEKEN